ncbi:MAG: hypothetical protein K0S54_1799 [Alphaproteobacteria bacterium]|jgi:uncharacterized membrane protein (UPF0127 family)|nr:hypothetical protein [Alphaproteobacteria bacterium]
MRFGWIGAGAKGVAVALALLLGAASAQAQTQQSPAPSFEQDDLAIRTSSGEIKFRVELALSPPQQQYGLMFRQKLDPYTGMLFDFGAPRIVSMWMMNTLIPLDMVFIAADGRIVNVAANTKPMSTDTILSQGPAKGVLEIAGGTARLLGIKAGDVVLHRVFGTGK